MRKFVFFLFLFFFAFAHEKYFVIQVIDSETGRGVPLVELKTVNEVCYYTDSNGIVAFYEPGLMDQKVFFYVKSHGYLYEKDGFGIRGRSIQIIPGGRIKLKIKRINIAKRLYRITGQGIYRDSILAGLKVPLKKPLLNGKVFGQDTVMMMDYKNKLYWFWGDTNRASYPLGNFAVSGATSPLPGKKLSPELGIDLSYFVDSKGFSKKMCPRPAPGVVWLEGLLKVRDPKGNIRLLAQYERLKNLTTVLERGLAIFDDQKRQFVSIKKFDLKNPLYPRGHPVEAIRDGERYFCFGLPHPSPFPNVRVKAKWSHVLDLSKYEVFTFQNPKHSSKKIKKIYSWRKNGIPIASAQEKKMIQEKKLSLKERFLPICDISTGKKLQIHAGSVFWNAYRKKWILIGEQVYGTSLLGEIWYSEADTLIGPWVYAQKIITHEKYSFYNPTQHPIFDQENGRIIYFEGTYTNTFTNSPPTPRYNYNQIMYQLDLADQRLYLPSPVYRVNHSDTLMMREILLKRGKEKQISSIAFFALEPARKRKGTISVFGGGKPFRLSLEEKDGLRLLFYILDKNSLDKKRKNTKLLYEYRKGNKFFYSTVDLPQKRLILGTVWTYPIAQVIADFSMKPRE